MSDQSLEQIQERALAAVDAASTLVELEDARVAHTGRRSPLAEILAGIGGLPPEQRGAGGKAATLARRAGEAALAARTAAAGGRGAGRGARARRRRRHAARRPVPARGPAPDHADPARDGGHPPGSGLPDRRRPRGRDRVAQLHGPQHAPGTSGALAQRHLLHRRAPGPDAAHPDLPGAGARDAALRTADAT